MKNLLIIFLFLSLSKLSLGQVSDTLALNMNQFGNCTTPTFDLFYYFENVDTVVFHIDFGNNTDTIITGSSSGFFYPYNGFSSIYVYSGNYNVQVTAETTSGILLDQKTYNFAIVGGEGCSQETIYKIRNDFSNPFLTDTIPINFTGPDGITHTIYPENNAINHYLTNPLLYPAQISVNAAWLTAHNCVQLNTPLYYSAPTINEGFNYMGWPALIISRTDIPNENNSMFSSGSSSNVGIFSQTYIFLNLNNTTNAIPDSINRIRVEYDPFLQVSHDTLLNVTEGTGFIEFDVELLNLYQSIPFGITASSAQSLDSIYFRCFYLNNNDQNAQDDTTTLYFQSENPCAGLTDSVLNISLNSTLEQFGNSAISSITVSKNICPAVYNIGITVHHSPFIEYDNGPNFQFSQVNDSTLHTVIPIYEYMESQTIQLIFHLGAAIPPGTAFVNYSTDILDADSTDNFTGDTLLFIACDSVDFSINSLSANMIAPIQSGICYISPIMLSPCFLTDTSEIQITFPGYVSMDSTALALGTFTDSTFHLPIDWSNQNLYSQIAFHIPGTIPSGTPYTITAKIIGENDIDTTNNVFVYNGIVLNSYDPNEKHADLPSALDPDLQEKITYTVHFQNDGNLEAYNIVVRDTLSPGLDLSSFRFLGASHPCEVNLDVNTREVVFNFTNIMLPSSELDSLGSQGIFSYQLTENANLLVGSVIENTAHIYFDFNPAIITNTTHHVNEASLGTSELTSEMVVLYPNPAEDKIKFRGDFVKEFFIYDLTGKMVFETHQISNNEVSLNNLQTGIYQVVLKTDYGISTQKLVIKK